MQTLEIDEDSIWGPNFKIRCVECCAVTSWLTLQAANEWWLMHHTVTMHCRMAKFIRKQKVKETQ